ncbi:MAG: hypothetical protein SOT07_04985, partial [Paludibacteraceae bacterium]|nr:hypothetical protein [Paludibacteraceae bacterium]
TPTSCDKQGSNQLPRPACGEGAGGGALNAQLSTLHSQRSTFNAQLPASIPVRVVEKGMKANALSHAYPVRAEVLRREGLLPGMVSKVCMTGQQSEGLLIPAACVQVTPEGKSVWVVQEDSTAVRRMVQIGQYVPDGVLVIDGLQTGDRVVTDGFQKLYKGAKVKEI